jgi:hypothetical protein
MDPSIVHYGQRLPLQAFGPCPILSAEAGDLNMHRPTILLLAGARFPELARPMFEHLQSENVVGADRRYHTVWDLSYAGDEGGILCHMSRSEETGRALVVSLTYVRVHPSMPLAAAVLAYQKHRVKKLKKQGRASPRTVMNLPRLIQ